MRMTSHGQLSQHKTCGRESSLESLQDNPLGEAQEKVLESRDWPGNRTRKLYEETLQVEAAADGQRLQKRY